MWTSVNQLEPVVGDDPDARAALSALIQFGLVLASYEWMDHHDVQDHCIDVCLDWRLRSAVLTNPVQTGFSQL